MFTAQSFDPLPAAPMEAEGQARRARMDAGKPNAAFISSWPHHCFCGSTLQMLLWRLFPHVWVHTGMCNTNCKLQDFRAWTHSSCKTSMGGSMLQWPDNSWPQCECNYQIYDSKCVSCFNLMSFKWNGHIHSWLGPNCCLMFINFTYKMWY